MPAKKNPLGLNPLQLKTLTLMQELARSPNHASPRDGGAVEIGNMPHPHGDHFHVGHAVVMTADATGLFNEAAWKALERKGLIQSDFPHGALVTAEGIAYETGLADQILHRSHH
jgi:ribosomal protein S19E (S16A)